MTLNLYPVDDALTEEDKLLARIQKALDWKLRAKEKGEKEIEEASNAPEESVPPEAH